MRSKTDEEEITDIHDLRSDLDRFQQVVCQLTKLLFRKRLYKKHYRITSISRYMESK